MPLQRISPAEFWRAIEVYLRLAYPGVTPPSPVRAKLETLHSVSPEDFFTSSVFERDTPISPSKVSLRLGNQCYPHMKLSLVRSPDRTGYLFHADTHDTHCCPAAGTRDYADFLKLMEANQTLASAIESAWDDANLSTFKTYLRDDLARRAGKP